MSHAERALQPEELIVYRARLHWVIYAPGVLTILGASLAAVYGGPLKDMTARYGFLAIAAALGATGLFSILRASFRSVNTELVLSTQRILYSAGLSRSAKELYRGELESINVSQSVLGRQLNFGTLHIRGGGCSIGPVGNVAAPRDFHRHADVAER